MGQGPFLDAPAGTGHDGHIGSGQAVRRQTLAPGPSFTGNIGKREFDGIDAAAEDAVQEALLRAWQKRGTLRDMAAFRSWLCRIVANTCTELLRRKQRTTLTDIPEEMPAPQSDAIDHMAVMDALAELTPQMRVCMTLHYLDGWRVPEIAQMLDIPEGTVKTRLMHARKRMETLLREVET